MEDWRGTYEPLPSMAEDGAADGGAPDPHALLLGGEEGQWETVGNLDQFFSRIYRYWEEKGFAVMLTARLLNLLALAFTAAMSALLLLYVNWGALQAECLKKDTCDIWEVAIRRHPLAGGWSVWTALAVLYLALFAAYWLAAAAHLTYEVRDLAEIRHFCNTKLGISERQMGTVTWPEVVHRLVQIQRTRRLCVARDLCEHDIVARIMRKENYLVGMLNKGVLALNVPVPGFRRHLLLTKTLEWNLYWCVLDAMFDSHFRLKPAFLHNEAALRRRLRLLALANLAAAPFLLVFLAIYFFMKNAERFYHHPSSVGARRWSPLAQWRLREFNELPHFIKHRLNASHKAAEAYISQFPSPVVSHVARFVAFIAGSAAALLLSVTLIDERLLERDLFGRQLVWWVAVVGVVLALSRAFVVESCTAFDPEAALMEVVAHTHYLPRHWRGRAHTREVQAEFEALFQFKALLFLEELASILLTPLLLWCSLPQCAGALLSFVESNTVYIEGVGDVCSLAAFDFQRHGNARYGSPTEAPKDGRSRQGKMEKSFLSFAATYPAWEPDAAGQQLLQQVAAAPAAAPLAGSLAWSMLAQPAAVRRSPASPRQPKAGVAALLQRGGRPGADSGGIFASADLTPQGQIAAAAAAHLAASVMPAGAAAEGPADLVGTSQLLLQSLYEQRRQQHWPPQPPPQQQQHGEPQASPQEQPQEPGSHPLARSGLAPAVAQPPAGPQPPRQQIGFAAVQAPLPIPRQQQPTAAASPGRPAAAASPSPQQRLLLQSAGGAAASPRQSWLGRSPSGRTRVSELSVLSRENSAAGTPAVEGSGAIGGGGAAGSSGSGASGSSSSEHAESGWAPQQHQSPLQHSGHSGSHSAGGDDGPPEFF